MGDSTGMPYQTVIKETDTSERVSFRISGFKVIINKQKLREITGKQLKIKEEHELKGWHHALNKWLVGDYKGAYDPILNRIILDLNACLVSSYDVSSLKKVITKLLAHETAHRLRRFYPWRRLEGRTERLTELALKNPAWSNVVKVVEIS